MPTNSRFHGAQQQRLTFAHLDKFAGGARGYKQTFLSRYAFGSVAGLRDDFVGDTFDTNLWTTNAGTGATAFAVPATPGLGGTVQGATGTNATASNRMVNLYGAPIWSGDKSCGLEVRLKSDLVTNWIIEVGFLDSMTSITTPAPAVTDVDTPSFAGGVGDAALFVMDTLQTLTTAALVCLGSNSINASGSKDAISTYSPTAATYFKVRLQLFASDGTNGNDVVVWVDDNQLYVVQKTAAIEGGTLLRPWVFIGGSNATTHVADIDYIDVWQDR